MTKKSLEANPQPDSKNDFSENLKIRVQQQTTLSAHPKPGKGVPPQQLKKDTGKSNLLP